MDVEKLSKEWSEKVEEKISKNMPRVRELMDRARNEYNLEIWLGGPGKGHKELYQLRKCVKKVLEERNFKVHFSEDHDLGVDVANKEALEAESYDLIIILAITPGASIEAMEFAHIETIKPRLSVYIPNQYKEGYFYKSLSEKHKIITEECTFCKIEFEKGGSKLVETLIIKAENYRCDKFRRGRMETETKIRFP